MCFQCMILVCETYTIVNELIYTIFIIKSWDAKWCECVEILFDVQKDHRKNKKGEIEETKNLGNLKPYTRICIYMCISGPLKQAI